MTALTELEMMFNATIRLADKVTELRRYWKALEGKDWRFSAIAMSERWWMSTGVYSANSTAGRLVFFQFGLCDQQLCGDESTLF